MAAGVATLRIDPELARSNLPATLRELPHWITWSYGPPDEKGKRPKKPRASTVDPGQWRTFEDAMTAANGSAGLGFCFCKAGPDGYGKLKDESDDAYALRLKRLASEADELVGIDLDGCVDAGGVIEPWAQEIVDKAQTYTEYSISGSGVHLIGTGTLPPGRRRKHALECYDRGRYFTVSARPVPDTPEGVRSIQPLIDWLYAEFFPVKPDPPPAPKPPTLTHDQVLRRAAAYLARIDGAVSGQGGHDQTFKAALEMVKGFALSEDEALSLLLEHYNPRCSPPWSERELRHKVESAARSNLAAGYRLDQLPVTLPAKSFAEQVHEAEATIAAPKAPITAPKAPDPADVEPLPYITASTIQHKERAAPDMLLPGVKLHGRTLIVAPSETGKTWFALELGAKAASGGLICGQWQVPRPVRVLGIFAEDEPDDLSDRAAMLFQGGNYDMDLLDQNFRIVSDPSFWFGDAVARARLLRLVADFGPELIIGDTVQAISDIKSFKDAEDVTRFYRQHIAPLRAAAGGPCGVAMSHHTNKLAYAFEQQTDESGLIHGSDAFRRISDAVVFLRPATEVHNIPKGGSAFVVSTNKQRVGRRRGTGKHLVFVWPDQTSVFMNKPDHETPVSLVYDRELSGDEAARLIRRKRPSEGLIDTLSSTKEPLTKEQLTERLGKSQRTVSGYLSENKGVLQAFVQNDDGTFRAATEDDISGKSGRPIAYGIKK